jgi:photosystem II stability/assembly factor-like uncharacterized protein
LQAGKGNYLPAFKKRPSNSRLHITYKTQGDGMKNNAGSKLLLIGLSVLLLSNASSLKAAWVNATGNLAGLPSECEQIAAIWAIPNVNKIFTVVSGNGSYETTNGGSSWAKTSSVVNFRFMQMLNDPVNPNVWWACGIYHSPGVVKTTDAGATWTGLGNAYHNDGFSVDFSDPQRKLILAGAHEASKTLWKTTNEGQTWTNIGGNLPTGTSCWPYIIDSQTYLMGLQRVGIYKTTDGGGS